MQSLLKNIKKAKEKALEKKEPVNPIPYHQTHDDDDHLQTALPSANAFDENSFHFQLTSTSNFHSDVLIASATFREGENADMPVPLHCTWYNIGDNSSEFVQIPQASGACF